MCQTWGKKGQGGLGMLIRRFRQAMKPTTHWLLGHQQQQTEHKSRQVGHCRLLYPVLAVAEILLWSALWISVLKKITFLVNVVITDLLSKTSRHPLTSSQIYNILFINVFDILFFSCIYLIACNITAIIWIVFVTSRRKMLTFVNDLW